MGEGLTLEIADDDHLWVVVGGRWLSEVGGQGCLMLVAGPQMFERR